MYPTARDNFAPAHVVEIRMPGSCVHVGAKGQVKFSFPGLCSLELI